MTFLTKFIRDRRAAKKRRIIQQITQEIAVISAQLEERRKLSARAIKAPVEWYDEMAEMAGHIVSLKMRLESILNTLS